MPQSRRLIVALASVALLGACAKGEQAAQQPADSTAQNLALAPTGGAMTGSDQPKANPAARKPAAPAVKPKAEPPKPAAPTTFTAAAGTFLDAAVTDTLTTKTAKAGDAFTATVVDNVKDARGDVVIPQGATVHGKVAEVKDDALTLSVESVNIRGADYALSARIDSLETVKKSKAIGGHDVARVGIGAAAGAILGRVIGGNSKGAVIGGVVGAGAGTAVAAKTHGSWVILPRGAHINFSLTAPLTVKK
ncbi:MAG TPA: hypothetical protein VI160_07365 [Gemmatimonadales bacterium]